MAITFEICDVARATRPLQVERVPRAVLGLLDTPVEACGSDVDFLVAVKKNAFLTAAWRAFQNHHPLVLTPDAIWLCIAQGFALHVNQHAEQLRGRFVSHQGRHQLLTQRDDFIKGSPNNPWPEVFADFSQQIAGYIGRQRDLVVCDFSTTGPVERAASEIVLMDAMQQYFEYTMLTVCGIPEITLTGTVDDWRSIRRRTEMLTEYGLKLWTATLLPILDEFVAAATGRPDVGFWRHIFKHSYHGGSGGGNFLHGWILLFFPYFTGAHAQSLYVNPILTHARGMSPIAPGGGAAAWVSREQVSPDGIPLGLSRAPLQWYRLGKHFPMELIGGFVGVAQDPNTLALRPAIGWAVRDLVEPRVAQDRPVTSAQMNVLDEPILVDEDEAEPHVDKRASAAPAEPDRWLAKALADDDPGNT